MILATWLSNHSHIPSVMCSTRQITQMPGTSSPSCLQQRSLVHPVSLHTVEAASSVELYLLGHLKLEQNTSGASLQPLGTSKAKTFICGTQEYDTSTNHTSDVIRSNPLPFWTHEKLYKCIRSTWKYFDGEECTKSRMYRYAAPRSTGFLPSFWQHRSLVHPVSAQTVVAA